MQILHDDEERLRRVASSRVLDRRDIIDSVRARGAPVEGRNMLIKKAVSGIAASLACLATAVLVLMVFLDVSGRALFNSPFSWTIEVATYLMAAIALFGFPYAERKDANIRVEIGLALFHSDARCLLERLGRWLAVTLILVAAWQGFEYSYSSYTYGRRAWGVLETELWIPQLVLGPAFLLLSLQLLWNNLDGTGRSASTRRAAMLGLVVLVVACVSVRDQSPTLLGMQIPLVLLLVLGYVVLIALLASFKEGVLVAALMAAIGGSAAFASHLDTLPQGLALASLLGVLLLLGVQIGYALGVSALVGIIYLLPAGQLTAMPERIWSGTTSFELTAVPAFVLMGILLLRSGITSSVFERLAIVLSRVRGGLAHASVLACGIFATVSGSSMATAATIGAVACPEMLSRNYDRRLVFGCVAAGGTLGILIPPSIAMIIYGSVVGVSVSALFMAGVLPGLLLLALFLLVIVGWTTVQTRDPAAEAAVTCITAANGGSLRVVAFALLVLSVLGSIYLGFTTPTEAGAVGALGALLLCAAFGKLSWEIVRGSLLETVQVTGFLMLIVAFASVLTYVIDFTRLPSLVIQLMAPIVGQPLLLFLGICLVYIVLGMFIEPVSMMLVTLPIVFPLITAAGFDPVWFGIVLVVLMEFGLLTPPIGINLFVIKGVVPSSNLREIAIGALPFLLAMLLMLLLLYVWPSIALWLPAQMK